MHIIGGSGSETNGFQSFSICTTRNDETLNGMRGRRRKANRSLGDLRGQMVL